MPDARTLHSATALATLAVVLVLTGVSLAPTTLGHPGNPAATRLAAEGGGAALPELTGPEAESLAGGSYSQVTFKAGQTFYRAEGWSASAPGRYLGLENADTAAQAVQAYNIAKWGNPTEVMRAYRLNQDTAMYIGSVEGGEGYQALISARHQPVGHLGLLR